MIERSMAVSTSVGSALSADTMSAQSVFMSLPSKASLASFATPKRGLS